MYIILTKLNFILVCTHIFSTCTLVWLYTVSEVFISPLALFVLKSNTRYTYHFFCVNMYTIIPSLALFLEMLNSSVYRFNFTYINLGVFCSQRAPTCVCSLIEFYRSCLSSFCTKMKLATVLVFLFISNSPVFLFLCLVNKK